LFTVPLGVKIVHSIRTQVRKILAAMDAQDEDENSDSDDDNPAWRAIASVHSVTSLLGLRERRQSCAPMRHEAWGMDSLTLLNGFVATDAGGLAAAIPQWSKGSTNMAQAPSFRQGPWERIGLVLPGRTDAHFQSVSHGWPLTRPKCEGQGE
jgi:hypothetical protein